MISDYLTLPATAHMKYEQRVKEVHANAQTFGPLAANKMEWEIHTLVQSNYFTHDWLSEGKEMESKACLDQRWFITAH